MASEGGSPIQNFFHQHFLNKDHHGLLKDCEIRLIDRTSPSVPNERGSFWVQKLKTLAPLEINVVEGV